MKRFNKFLVLFLVVVMAVGLLPAGVSAATESPEVIYECDFENVSTFTNTYAENAPYHEQNFGAGTGSIVTDAENALSGSKYIKLEPSYSTSKDADAMGWVHVNIPVSEFEVGATYKVSAWFKADKAGAKTNLMVQSNHPLLYDSPISTVGTEWTRQEFTFDMKLIPETASEQIVKFRFGSSAYPVDGYLLVDDISIVKVPAPDRNQVLSEGFEGWVPPNFTTAGTENTVGTNARWNGASPSAGWKMGTADGEVLVQPVKEDNGNVYMQLTTKKGGGQHNLSRVKLIYTVPQSMFDKMEDGAEYIFSFDVKGDSELKANYELKNIPEGATTWKTQDFSITSEWVTYSYTFTLNKAGIPSTTPTLDAIVGLGWVGNTALDKKICIDNVSIVKVVNYDYTAIESELAEGDAKLQADVDGTGNDLVLKTGKTLDLAGYTLTVDSLSAMPGAKVIDSVGTGKIVVANDNLTLQADNGYLPVKTNEGYIFVTVKDQHDPLVVEPDTLKYKTRPSLEKVASSTYLGDGATDNGLSIMIRLTWTNTSNGTTTTMDVKCTDKLVGDVYTNLESFELTVTGVDSVENLQVATVICSDTGVVVVGEALPYNALQ